MKFKLHLPVPKFSEKKSKKLMGARRLRCNICSRLFRAASSFHRFCRTCKEESELFKFHDWLPAPT